MDKVAILTRTSATNFGTILQSYALQKYIKSLGDEVFVVDDSEPRKIYQNNIFEKKNLTEKRTFKEKIVGWIDYIRLKRRYARSSALQKRIDAFKRKNIEYFYINNLSDLNENFDVFISGSDQIWAYAAEPMLFSFFMQETIGDNKRKVSYGVSVGEKNYPLKHIPTIERLLNKFNYISVREETSRQILCQYTKKEVCIVCDPVFLLNSDEWKEMAGRRKIKKKYIFCYFLSDNIWYSDKIKELSEELDCEVYVFRKENTLDVEYKNIKICTPNEFLNYIEFAEFVLTDSYHAFLFSMIFNKKFNILKRFEENTDNVQNSRIQDLMERLEIEDRFLTKKDGIILSTLDYSYINQKIELFRKDSEEFLKMCLK